jgi:hypothetical protein
MRQLNCTYAVAARPHRRRHKEVWRVVIHHKQDTLAIWRFAIQQQRASRGLLNIRKHEGQALLAVFALS